MKLTLKTAILASLSLFLAGHLSANAQQAPAPPAGAPAAPTAPNRVAGAVTAVSGSTITVHDRRSDTDITVAVTDATKYSKTVTVGIDTLAVGNIIMAGGREELAAGATSVDAARINVLPELPKENRPNTRAITGTIVTTTPTLTVKTADGTTYTVNTTATTQVSTLAPAALTDVAVGNYVTVEGKNDGTTLTAREVRIMPARRPRPAN